MAADTVQILKRSRLNHAACGCVAPAGHGLTRRSVFTAPPRAKEAQLWSHRRRRNPPCCTRTTLRHQRQPQRRHRAQTRAGLLDNRPRRDTGKFVMCKLVRSAHRQTHVSIIVGRDSGATGGRERRVGVVRSLISASKCRLSRVQKCINFAARLVTGVRRSDHISPSLDSLGWVRIDVMIARHDSANVHKAM